MAICREVRRRAKDSDGSRRADMFRRRLPIRKAKLAVNSTMNESLVDILLLKMIHAIAYCPFFGETAAENFAQKADERGNTVAS
ncbi:hypothetical protein [Caulobacter sp. LARHSG274]